MSRQESYFLDSMVCLLFFWVLNDQKTYCLHLVEEQITQYNKSEWSKVKIYLNEKQVVLNAIKIQFILDQIQPLPLPSWIFVQLHLHFSAIKGLSQRSNEGQRVCRIKIKISFYLYAWNLQSTISSLFLIQILTCEKK